MKKQKRFAVIGGDLRQIRLANALAADGYDVSVFGFDNNIEFLHIPISADLTESIDNADIVVLPLPASFDGENINTPLFKYDIAMGELLQTLNQNQLLLAGRVDNKTSELIQLYDVEAIDYFLREELTVLNAIPTAEGGIEIALSEMPTTLHGSKCLVLGFGRIGKVLCKMLSGMGANVTAMARSHEALAWINTYNYGGAHLDTLSSRISEFDVIFNTVPSKIITSNVLNNMRSDSLIIDLASKPGGVDMATAKELGIKTIWALSLPGKVAPITAGDIIKQSILNICNELGI